MAKGTTAGRVFRAEEWLPTSSTSRAGCGRPASPFPIQCSGWAILSEYLGDDEFTAPRLVHARLTGGQAEDLFAQAVTNVRLCAAQGVVHGDLSPYNMLVWVDRLFLIDFPQAVDPIAHPDGLRLMERDVANLCQWAQRHGVVCDPGEVFAEVIGAIF